MDTPLLKARKIKLLLLDVDGILTDGRIRYNEIGQEVKVFHVQDGQGIRWLVKAGLAVGVISGRRSPAVEVRAGELGISHLYQGVDDKIAVFETLKRQLSLSAEEVAYGGDDFIDLKLLRAVGLSFSVPNGHPLIQREVDYVTRNPGGGGAVREICELILQARGRWEALLREYGFKPGPSPRSN